MLNSDSIASGTDNTEAVYSVERYMNDLLAMHTLIRPVSDSISRLFTVYEQMSNTTDSQELDALSSEAKELTAKVTTVYASKVKGVSYSILLELLTYIQWAHLLLLMPCAMKSIIGIRRA